jgi:hypothetical protein
VSKRRYQLRSVALELFLVSGESHLIVFRNQTYRCEKRQQVIFTIFCIKKIWLRVLEHPFFRCDLGIVCAVSHPGAPCIISLPTDSKDCLLTFSTFNKKLYYLKDECTVVAPCLMEKSVFKSSGIVLESCYLTRACLSIHVVTIFKPSLGVGARYKKLFPSELFCPRKYIPRLFWFVNFMHFQTVFRIRIRVRRSNTGMFLGLPDPHPDPLVTCT